jgi:hypothetical protein
MLECGWVEWFVEMSLGGWPEGAGEWLLRVIDIRELSWSGLSPVTGNRWPRSVRFDVEPIASEYGLGLVGLESNFFGW